MSLHARIYNALPHTGGKRALVPNRLIKSHRSLAHLNSESAVSEMANWSKAVHSEMMHQKNWHKNWHYLSKDAGPGDMTEKIQTLKDQLAK